MSARNQTLNGVTLTTTSEAGQVSLLCEALHALCLYASGSEQCALALQTAAAEALNNVVVHAYHNQSGHEIAVRWSQENHQLRIEIMDNGSSIAYLPKPTLPEFEAEGSRGWWIINACVDDYFYRTIENFDSERLLKAGAEPAGGVAPTVKPHTNILTLLKQF